LEKRLFVELTEKTDPDRYRAGYRWKIDKQTVQWQVIGYPRGT
jgi:hypothetical protein